MDDHGGTIDRFARLERLARWLPELESGALDFGRWEGGDRQPDGSLTMPYFTFSPRGLELVRDLPVEPFDWPRWLETDEAQGLLADQAKIATATAEQLVQLSTALVRSNRFSEGSLASAFQNGQLLAIVRRAAALSGG